MALLKSLQLLLNLELSSQGLDLDKFCLCIACIFFCQILFTFLKITVTLIYIRKNTNQETHYANYST